MMSPVVDRCVLLDEEEHYENDLSPMPVVSDPHFRDRLGGVGWLGIG